jgi:hypothetical protein
MRSGSWIGGLGLVAVGVALAACGRRALPDELVGSYARSGEGAGVRAELSIARGGVVLTGVRLTASADIGAYTALFGDEKAGGGTTGARLQTSADVGRSVTLARTFDTLTCDGTRCSFVLEKTSRTPACKGTLEKVQSTIIVVAPECAELSGRWTSLETAAPRPTPDPASTAAPARPEASGDAQAPKGPSPSAKPEFPPDIPAPHDHMSCLSACSIVDTRCHRTTGPGREAFLACVESAQICRARCEEAWPFFGE